MRYLFFLCFFAACQAEQPIALPRWYGSSAYYGPQHWWAEQAYTHLQRAEYQAAILDYQRAWNCDPGHPQLALHLGFVYWQLKDYTEAYSWLAIVAKDKGSLLHTQAQAYLETMRSEQR